MTHEEHAARAMLLGMVYDWRDSTYCVPSSQNREHLGPHGMLDAKTMEPIDSDVSAERMTNRGLHQDGINILWWDTPTREADYDD